ncbi:MAG TPA: MobA/MobL family protein [Vicinamibacterales bacterium]|nr:MobA/MobL family protein [Vicinamibacterales bacterium]
MDLFDRKPELIGGGRPQSNGCYHLSFRSGSRASGASAGAAHAYITRSDQYDDDDRDPAIYTESAHMPSWAEDDANAYWDAADLFERANARLYVSADFALPRDLDREDQIALAHTFADELTSDHHLPYTLAIHAGTDQDGHEHNPHAHLMISERQNDGIERDHQQWFKRADSAHPERGGAPKTREIHGHDWMESARERWAELTNEMFERNGRTERIDHRSYERQGVDREPGEHFGPAAAYMVNRGLEHDRLRDAADDATAASRVPQIDRAIASLEDQQADTDRSSYRGTARSYDQGYER